MKVWLFIVPCYFIILFFSEGMKKNVSEFISNFFRRFIIYIGNYYSIILFSPMFLIFPIFIL